MTIELRKRQIIGTGVSVVDYDAATEAVLAWADTGESYSTCHVNSHTVIHGRKDKAHGAAMNAADLVTPDGMPVVRMLKLLGEKQKDRVTGPHLMMFICERAAEKGVPIGLYGGKPETLDALEKKLMSRFPNLNIAYKFSPPFRPLTDDEKLAEETEMVKSGAKIFFIGLGCPKQELYVHEKKQRSVPGVFMAVGAAIDINAGTVKQAPSWMQKSGMEWLFRLSQDPKRLWRRYAKYPILFILFGTADLLKVKLGAKRSA